MTFETDNNAGRSVWPVGILWTATVAGVVSLFWQAPAQSNEPLRLDQFTNIEPVALAPDDIAGTAPIAATSIRPVQRDMRAATLVDPGDTYSLWPDSTLVSMYDSHWSSLQDNIGEDAGVLEDRMGAIWDVLQQRGLTDQVAGPELAKVSAYLTEATAH